jgi:SAM-dependent methyltransferase
MSKSERVVEVPWVTERIGRPARALDIGAAGSEHLEALARACPEAYALDTRPVAAVHGLATFTLDAAHMPENWGGRFDLVTAVSVIDHIGLASYGNPDEPGKLERVCAEIARVTAPGGRLLLTVPFGRAHLAHFGPGLAQIFDLGLLYWHFPSSLWGWPEGGPQFWRLVGDAYRSASLAEVAEAGYAGWRAAAAAAVELVRL